jgi:putative RecB family exonuclease
MNGVTLLPGSALPAQRRDIWSYVSPSRLNLWLKCPLAFRLRYRDGVESPMTRAQFVGRRVHAALEFYYRHRQLEIAFNRADVLAAVQSAWSPAVETDRIEFADAADETACRQQTADLVCAYLDRVSPAESRPLMVEASLDAPLVDPDSGEDLGLPLVGIVDLVLDDGAGPTIIDFKTANRGGDVNELLHEVQLTSYAYLYRDVANRREAALEIRNLIKTKTPKIETHQYAGRTRYHMRRLFAVIRAYLDDLDHGRFVFRPGLTCSSCEFRDSHCRAWTG